jgi:hypothetical protein
VNFFIHTDAIKANLIPQEISKIQVSFVYVNEAAMLNVALSAKRVYPFLLMAILPCFAYDQ